MEGEQETRKEKQKTNKTKRERARRTDVVSSWKETGLASAISEDGTGAAGGAADEEAPPRAPAKALLKR